MHNRVDWMTPADDAILHLLDQSNLELSASNIAHNLGYQRNYVSKRCRRLSEQELAEPAENDGGPYYGLSDRGRSYVDGDLRPEELKADS